MCSLFAPLGILELYRLSGSRLGCNCIFLFINLKIDLQSYWLIFFCIKLWHIMFENLSKCFPYLKIITVIFKWLEKEGYLHWMGLTHLPCIPYGPPSFSRSEPWAQIVSLCAPLVPKDQTKVRGGEQLNMLWVHALYADLSLIPQSTRVPQVLQEMTPEQSRE